MLADLRVGPSYSADGNLTAQRATRDGCSVASDGHARHFEAVYRQNVYIGADLGGTAVTTQAGLSATTPALTLYNPANSNKLAVLLELNVALNAAPAAATFFMLAVNSPTAAAPTATTNATIQNAYTNNVAAGAIACYRIATLAAAPLAIRFWNGVTGASALTPAAFHFDLGGSIIVAPGVALSIQTSAAAAIVAAFTWEEVPV